MDEDKRSYEEISKLVEKYDRAATGESGKVTGVIDSYDEFPGENVMILRIRDGGEVTSLALKLDAVTEKPLPGSTITATLDTVSDFYEFAGETSQWAFDFDNKSDDSDIFRQLEEYHARHGDRLRRERFVDRCLGRKI